MCPTLLFKVYSRQRTRWLEKTGLDHPSNSACFSTPATDSARVIVTSNGLIPTTMPEAPPLVARSLIAPEYLAARIESDYALGTVSACQLAAAGDNDTYATTVAGTRYVVRVYRYDRPWISGRDAYLFELELLQYLHDSGIAVSYALPRTDGDPLGEIEAPEGVRYWVLFTHASGVLIYPPSTTLATTFGARVAELHLAANDFLPSHQRFDSDLHLLVDWSLESIAQHVGACAELDALQQIAGPLRESIVNLGIDGDGWGVIGGDFHGGNSHVEGDEITFFDFDQCGYGWRAYDLAVLMHNARLGGMPTELIAPYLDGYRSVRPLSDAEERSLDLFTIARRIHRLGQVASEVPVGGRRWIEHGTFSESVATVRRWAHEYL